MSVLLIRLAAPMQSWGIQSRFTIRETATEPSKSGVVGLLCAAAGISRSDTSRIAELGCLEMGVRVDQEGKLLRDFHTVGGGSWPDRPRYGVCQADGASVTTVLSERYYLADANFLVAMTGPDDLLEAMHGHLASPVWPLYLGRKAFVPGLPVWIPDGLRSGTVRSALTSYPWHPGAHTAEPDRLRLVLECPSDEGLARMDVPRCFESRSFGIRHVKVEWVSTVGLSKGIGEGEHVPFAVDS